MIEAAASLASEAKRLRDEGQDAQADVYAAQARALLDRVKAESSAADTDDEIVELSSSLRGSRSAIRAHTISRLVAQFNLLAAGQGARERIEVISEEPYASGFVREIFFTIRGPEYLIDAFIEAIEDVVAQRNRRGKIF